jgi:excisionase family DNA binding protein
MSEFSVILKPVKTIEVLTTAELAKRLRVKPITILRLEQRGFLRAVPGIRTRRFSREELDRFLSLHEPAARALDESQPRNGLRRRSPLSHPLAPV